MVRRHAAALSLSQHPWRGRRWLVLAPHPDDETLGAAALIAQTAMTGDLAGLVYLTDGSGSHPIRDNHAARLIATRTREANRALRRLTDGRTGVASCLGWKDAVPEFRGTAPFARSCQRLVSLCVQLQVDILATTAPQEPHCDHAAAAELAYAAQALSKRKLIVAEYIVWGSAPDARTHRALVTSPMLQGKRRYALAAHRSQLTASYGEGFRLSENQRTMASRDIFYIRRR